MYQINDLIIYGNRGVCMVEDIGIPSISGIDKNQQYYILIPVDSKGSVIYTPVDNSKISMRSIITIEKAQELLDNIQSIPIFEVDNERFVDDIYKRAINSNVCEELIKVIKTVYSRQQSKVSRGKKLGQTEERYMKLAEDLLYSELAIVFDKPKEKMKTYVELRALGFTP